MTSSISPRNADEDAVTLEMQRKDPWLSGPLAGPVPPDDDEGGGGLGTGGGLDEEVDVDVRPKSVTPRRYKVVFHNDDYTTMEFVILVLMNFFHKSETEATFIMLKVHKTGAGVAGVYSRDVAETKVAEVTKFARAHGMPLLVTAEPEDLGGGDHDDEGSQ
jgi:ATP-dependent Clp protease adaptor protein ClpS